MPFDLSELPPEDWTTPRKIQHSVRVVSFESLPGEVESFAIYKDSPPRRRRALMSEEQERKARSWAAKRALDHDIAAARCPNGLRSHTENSPSLRRIPQILPKRVRCGDGKGAVKREHSKFLALTRKRVTLDMRRLGALVVDLDRCFPSEWALKEALEGTGIPMPNLGAGEILHDGTFARPHLIWILPPGYEVWSGNHKHVAFWHAMHRRLVRALLPLGADVGQLANPYKFKNPLSNQWDCAIFSEKWHTLGEMATILDREISEGQIARESFELDASGSCADWNNAGKIIRHIMTSARISHDHSYMASVADPAALQSWLRRRTIEVVTAKLGKPSDGMLDIIARRTEYAAARWENRECNRGRDAQAISLAGKPPLKDRQKIAQDVTVAEVHAAIIEAIANAILAVVPNEPDVRRHRSRVAAKLKGFVARSTVYANLIHPL